MSIFVILLHNRKNKPQVLSKLNFIHSLIDHFLRLHITTTSKRETQTCTLMKLSRLNSSAFHHWWTCNSINLGRQPLSKGLFLPISKQCQTASSCLSYISEGVNKSNFIGCGKTLVMRGGRGSVACGAAPDHVPPAHWFLIFWHYLVAFYFLARLLFHVTKDTNVQTTDVGNIYYLSSKRAFPGIKAAESSVAVPRIGGMKISLFIMEANQISDAVCLRAKKIWKCVER